MFSSDLAAGAEIPVHKSANRGLRVCLWIAQVFLFVMFASGGVMKLILPLPKLANMMPWTGQLPLPFVRVIGLIDLCGGVGILLPSLTRIKPRLTVWAAIGCALLMVCAIVFHSSRGELSLTPFNYLLLGLSLLVLWGRSRQSPIIPHQ